MDEGPLRVTVTPGSPTPLLVTVPEMRMQPPSAKVERRTQHATRIGIMDGLLYSGKNVKAMQP
jgi:hypothetical protein